MTINKAALHQAQASRMKYRANTPLTIQSIEGEDTVFVAAYLEAIAAGLQTHSQPEVKKFNWFSRAELDLLNGLLLDHYSMINSVSDIMLNESDRTKVRECNRIIVSLLTDIVAQKKEINDEIREKMK